ncbi:hypothetical protein BVX98_06585 [bacterium F11]|nr:hypothetical protein BVX98_06585 [bacterium F11]
MNTEAYKSIQARLKRLNIHPSDLQEKFVRARGSGGQNVNKVSTCVILTHIPSGFSVRCEEERSQSRNRYLARKRLADQWEAMMRAKVNKIRYDTEKHKRQHRKRSKKAKERILESKHRRAQIKKLRRSLARDDY